MKNVSVLSRTISLLCVLRGTFSHLCRVFRSEQSTCHLQLIRKRLHNREKGLWSSHIFGSQVSALFTVSTKGTQANGFLFGNVCTPASKLPLTVCLSRPEGQHNCSTEVVISEVDYQTAVACGEPFSSIREPASFGTSMYRTYEEYPDSDPSSE